ncbi:type IV pilus assembly protein PilQ [Desulfosarcina sp. BuS5]|uniref:type IV pilus secretin PilQ n=1 Tax=Desulfosarcina sp. BuS5 TaxID=933262 RepID=UPI00048A07E8|nr:type IV pilus secretin PilQ [Desulfosarcina sp. BuS5]WDN87747.1 type IV pilus assembly protein PilQ [Desulfosarcina sp. BuS5]
MKKYYIFKKILSGLAVFFICSALFSGCAGTGKEKNDLFFDKWKAVADKSEGYSPMPSEDTEENKGILIEHPDREGLAASSDLAGLVPKKPLPAEKVTLEMHDVEISVLLKTLARAVNQNIIISEAVTGRSYVSIKNTPWDQVFMGLLDTNGLAYEWEGDIIRIVTTDDINRALELMDAEQNLVAGRKEHEIEMERLRSRAKMAEPLQTWVYHVKYADTENLRDNLEEFFQSSHAGPGAAEEGKSADSLLTGMSRTKSSTSGLRGAILVDLHTNSLVIQAGKSDLERMRAMVLELDKPTLQVLIQAHIVEANSNTALELGIQWGGLYNGGDTWITPGANSTGITGAKLSEGIDPTAGMAANFPAALSDGKGLTLGVISESIGNNIITAQLSALEKEVKLNILSSPSITTLDNQKAIIESGKDIPYQTVEDEDVQIEWKKAVIRLEVTPYIIDGKTLKMKILTNKDEVDFSDTVMGNPVIITKSAETSVVLFDGQTTVIGGLSKENVADGESGVPFLKNIPFLGYFFKGISKENVKEELLIFITPYILKEKS